MSTPSVAPYDVVVVGARPAGAATALVLARAGLRILVVDRGIYGADTVSPHASSSTPRAALCSTRSWSTRPGTPAPRCASASLSPSCAGTGTGAARVTAGIFPTNRGQTCVFAGTSPQRYRLESRLGVASAYTRLLDQAAPGVLDADAGAPERLRVFAGRRPGLLRRASGPGWALVGDAGYVKDPITAHGLTDALRDAELLGRAIIAAAGGRLPRRWRSPPTRPPGTASRNGCPPSPTPTPSPGISTRSAGCCCS